MHFSYFDITVPVFIKNLHTLKALLAKGQAHALLEGMSEADFLAQRLAPDMFPLVKQVQMVTDNAKGIAARLGGVEIPTLSDNEESVAELLARIDTVLAFLETFTPEQFAEAAERKIVLPYIPGQYQRGADYLLDHALPNFFFHMTITYALIRAQGTPLGKMDFIGGLKLHPTV
jgi:hypothetical protein